MTAKISKTNAARLLESLGITYELHAAAVDVNDLSAVTMARNLGVDPACVFKTLVTKGDRTGVLMACIPAAAELDLKALALATGNKQVAMLPLKDVRPITGYVRGGCSPLAAKKTFPVCIDASAAQLDSMYVSAGHRGVQIKIRPEDLLYAAHAQIADIIRKKASAIKSKEISIRQSFASLRERPTVNNKRGLRRETQDEGDILCQRSK